MTLKESLLYSGLSASLSILAWGLRFAWKKWRKRKRDMQVKPGEAGDEEEKEEGLAEAAKSELPFTICGSLLKSAGQSAIDSYVKGDSKPRSCLCRRCCCV